MEHLISFPGIGISLNINRVAIDIFGLKIYWYGLIIAFGFMLALTYSLKRADSFGIKKDDIIDVLIIATPVAIICARIYYVAFKWGYYKNNIKEIFSIWEGGIAIYGAIIGGAIVLILFCKYKKIKTLDLLDLGALALFIGQSIGRWGNFVNAEAFGGETTLPWRMIIGEYTAETMHIGVHPTFLYESLWNMLGFVMIHFYSKRRKFSGEVMLMYISWYGLGRFFIEGLRTDSLYIGTIRVSQLLAIISFAIALSILVYSYIKMHRKSNSKG